MNCRVFLGVRACAMLAVISAVFTMSFAPRMAFAQTVQESDPCIVSLTSPECQAYNLRADKMILGWVFGVAAVGGVGWLVVAGINSAGQASRRARMIEHSNAIRDAQAEDLARVSAALAHLQNGGPNAADTSISVRSQVGSVDVRIHSTRSARAIAEAEALKRHSQSMSNHKEL